MDDPSSLAAAVERLAAQLRLVEEDRWSPWLAEAGRRLRRGDASVVQELLIAMTVEDGLAGLHICPESGHAVTAADVGPVNHRVARLLGEIDELVGDFLGEDNPLPEGPCLDRLPRTLRPPARKEVSMLTVEQRKGPIKSRRPFDWVGFVVRLLFGALAGFPAGLYLWARLIRDPDVPVTDVILPCMLVIGLIAAVWKDDFWEWMGDWLRGDWHWWDPRTWG